jgi:hypothetical protein
LAGIKNSLIFDLLNQTTMVTFFHPDAAMLKWLKEYAGNRLIIDVGCGTGHITRALFKLGAKVVGLDPFYSTEHYEHLLGCHILPWKIEDHPVFYKGQGNKVLLLFARPCHSDFVANTLDDKDDDTEALYITVPKNLIIYNDLGAHKNRAVLVNHEGTSKDDEVVYSVR